MSAAFTFAQHRLRRLDFQELLHVLRVAEDQPQGLVLAAAFVFSAMKRRAMAAVDCLAEFGRGKPFPQTGRDQGSFLCAGPGLGVQAAIVLEDRGYVGRLATRIFFASPFLRYVLVTIRNSL